MNLAKALAARGRSVGVLDADIYGHSVPAMLGVADSRPTAVEDMIMPVPTNGLKVISIGMLKPRRDRVVAWRGPILDRALTQMLGDVYWGDWTSCSSTCRLEQAAWPFHWARSCPMPRYWWSRRRRPPRPRSPSAPEPWHRC